MQDKSGSYAESKGKSPRKILLNHLILLACAVFYIIIMVKLKIYCPIRHFTGIPCAGCGMSRAAVSLLHLNIKASLESNPALIPCVSAFFLLIHRDTHMLSKLNRKVLNFIIYAGITFTGVTYVIRLLFFDIP